MKLPPEHLFFLIDNSIDAVLWMNLDKQFLYVSPAFADLTGHAPEELIAAPDLFERLVHPDDRERLHCHLANAAAPAQAQIDLRLTARNGQTRWFAHSCKPIYDTVTGQLTGHISHNRDITDRKTAELRLQTAMTDARRFNDALDHVGAFVFMRDAKYRFAYANSLTLEFFGTPVHKLIGVPDIRFFPPETIEQLRVLDQRVLAGEDAAGEVTIAHGDGSLSTYWVIESPLFENEVVIGITGIATDITARRAVEQELARNLEYQRDLNRKLEATRMQLLQAEKMAAIGQLAAGVAHEINNPIGFVSSNLRTLQSYLDDLFAITDAYAATLAPDGAAALAQAHALRQEKDYAFIRADSTQLMAETRDGLDRVARIVSDLRDFSHPGEATWQLADVHQELDASIKMAGITEGNGCRITRDYGELPRLWCVPAELNQVFINLLKNAEHAIGAQGEITLRTRHQDGQVSIAVADNGCGIAAKSLNRIFDPFYTTKPIGQGTGLGLALVHGIVAQHRGRIDVHSELGKGSTFTLWLPLSPPQETPLPPP